jgi:hypothetical protein
MNAGVANAESSQGRQEIKRDESVGALNDLLESLNKATPENQIA